MQRFRIFAAFVVASGGLVLGSTAANAEPPGTTDVSVAVPMTCNGRVTETRTITVSATLPNRVRAGRAYTITHLTADVPNGGAVTLTTSDGHPATFAGGSSTDSSSTLQLVAGPKPGGHITLQVASAGYLLPGDIISFPRPFVIPGVPVSCTPAAPMTLGAIKVIGQGSGPDTATTAVDATLGLQTNIIGFPFASGPGRVSATVPTELHPGDTFSLPDLQVVVPGIPFGPQAHIAVDGADPSEATATSVHTVTAPAGGTVDIRLVAIDFDISVVSSGPIGSGHIASIPVVAR